MKIRYLGTSAAEGFPAMFCACENCINAKKLGKSEIRTRSQVILNDELSVDFPPEAYAHSLEYGVDLSRLEYIFATHSHMDHFYAHDFILRGYKYARVNAEKLFIFGNSEAEKVFKECTAREMKPEVACNVKFTKISSYNEYNVADYRILTIPATHGNTEDALLYYFEKGGKGYLHLYDSGRVCDEAIDFLAKRGAKADLISFDCTFGDFNGGENMRHMGIGDNMVIKQKLSDCGIITSQTKIVITHFSHNCNPLRANLAKLERDYGVIAAYNGLEIEF